MSRAARPRQSSIRQADSSIRGEMARGAGPRPTSVGTGRLPFAKPDVDGPAPPDYTDPRLVPDQQPSSPPSSPQTRIPPAGQQTRLPSAPQQTRIPGVRPPMAGQQSARATPPTPVQRDRQRAPIQPERRTPPPPERVAAPVPERRVAPTPEVPRALPRKRGQLAEDPTASSSRSKLAELRSKIAILQEQNEQLQQQLADALERPDPAGADPLDDAGREDALAFLEAALSMISTLQPEKARDAAIRMLERAQKALS